MNHNIILAVDSYKISMNKQYVPGTEFVYSYVESRGGKWPNTLVFGLQAFLKEYLCKPITQDNIDEATEFYIAHGEPFNRDGWQYILDRHKGYLPVLIKIIDEGSFIPVHNVLATIMNTDPECFWLTTHIETSLLRALWFGTTVATNSFMCKVAILKALNLSSDDPLGQLPFKLHDFSARGVSSAETAALGGCAHLVNFMGTDTVEGVLAARQYYAEPIAGFSIPAAEHSTMTSFGRKHEVDAYRNMLTQFAKPGSMVAVVSDSYDLMNAVSNIWGDVLKQEVNDSGATVIIRPDSGDPLIVPVKVIGALSEKFGYTINSKGYKVLPSCVRVIQGDGIDADSLPIILDNILAAGFSADNIAFGMGGGLGQKIDRDTLKFAMKCSAARVNGVWRDVFKDPVTDPGKRSKKGRLALRLNNGQFTTMRKEDLNPDEDLLRYVFHNGKLLIDHKFSDIRQRANQAAIMMANILK